MQNRTFPLFSITSDGACSCAKGRDCGAIGKHPAVKGFTKGEVEYPPSEQQGCLTGDGLFVIDCDGPEAEAHFRSLGFPETFEVATPRAGGGVHFYFLSPADVVVPNDVGRKVHLHTDVRGLGGFVVAPGSKHKSGGVYSVKAARPVATAPQALLDMVCRSASERREASATAPKPIDGSSPEGQRRIGLFIEYCETAPPAVEGENGSGALWLVANTGMRVYELGLDDCVDVIEQFYNPRCLPPWDHTAITHKAEDARDRGTWLCGPPSDGFLERLRASSHGVVPCSPTPVSRMTKDPNHQYKMQLGDRPAGQKTKLSLGQTLAELDSHPDWRTEQGHVLSYDESSGLVIATNPPVKLDCEDPNKGITDADGIAIAAWFEVIDMYLVGKDMALAAALGIAKKNCFSPVRDYLNALPAPADMTLLDKMAGTLFGNTDPLVQTFFKKFLVAAVARAFEPGCFVKTMPVLVGKQDAGKSTFCHRLFGQWYKEGISDLKKKDALEELRGQWGIELGEMKAIHGADVETYKEFISRREDRYRASYGKGTGVVPRTCVFIGTGNNEEFLRDVTGDTRFWPIQLPAGWKIPMFDRDSLWSVAVALYRAGYSWWLDAKDSEAADELRQDFYEVDEWSGPISAYLQGRQEVTLRDIHEQVILNGDRDLSKLDKRTERRITDILRRLQAVPGRSNERRYWKVPDALAAMELKKTGLRVMQGGAGK